MQIPVSRNHTKSKYIWLVFQYVTAVGMFRRRHVYTWSRYYVFTRRFELSFGLETHCSAARRYEIPIEAKRASQSDNVAEAAATSFNHNRPLTNGISSFSPIQQREYHKQH